LKVGVDSITGQLRAVVSRHRSQLAGLREQLTSVTWPALAGAAVGALLAFRSAGLYPSVFGDEWTYSMMSRHTPIALARVPSYLFLLLFGRSSSCGEGFLDCARMLNAAFFGLSVPFIYLVCRKVSSARIALIVAILAVLSPVSSYSAYFMPEAMYFFGFWVYCWLVLSVGAPDRITHGTVVGAALGLLTMVKVHALFLLPGLCLYAGLAATGSGRGMARRCAQWLGASLIGLVATRALLGFALAGRGGISPVGAAYGDAAGTTLSDGLISRVMATVHVPLVGHLLGLAILFGVPLAIMSTASGRAQDGETTADSFRLVRLFMVSSFVPLFLITCVFTAAVTGSGVYETAGRLHMRYYNFIFPMFYILAAAGSRQGCETRRLWRILVAGAIAGITVYAIAGRMAAYTAWPVDCPELRAFTFNATHFLVLGGLGVAATACWIVNSRAGSLAYLLVFVPAMTIVTAAHTRTELNWRLQAEPSDNAGILTRHYVGAETSSLAVVGSNIVGIYRALFHIDDPNAAIVQIREGAPIDPTQLPNAAQWILVLGSHKAPPGITPVADADGYSLYRRDQIDRRIDFLRSSWPHLVNAISGISHSEPWGTWSNSDVLVIEMRDPLPRKQRIVIGATAFGPNVGRAFGIRVGEARTTFILTALQSEVSVDLQTLQDERTINIEIPKPTSPMELGLSADDRRLGLGLRYLRIEDITQR